jgi:hypothetical protein
MPLPDLSRVLDMRVAGEQARMDDLERLLQYAAAGHAESDRTALADRIAGRVAQVARLQEGEDGWTQWQDCAGDADLLVDELVALLMTRLLRLQGLDSGTFDAAEALLGELTGRAGLPKLILGQTQELESLDHTRASVALRFPGSRAWDLPFLGHEFGHHAVAKLPHIEPSLRDKRPLVDVAAAVAGLLGGSGKPGDRAWAHANELLADAVATVCCGPTYPVACLCLRVPSAQQASRSSATHPAWKDRMATMRVVLDALTQKTGRDRYRSQRSALVDPLVEALFDQVPPTSPAAAEAGERTVATILRHRKGLVYSGGDAAIQVAEGLKNRDGQPPAGATVVAVLDGAWRWRLVRTSGEEDDAVATLVVTYCRTINPRR